MITLLTWTKGLQRLCFGADRWGGAILTAASGYGVDKSSRNDLQNVTLASIRRATGSSSPALAWTAAGAAAYSPSQPEEYD
jgi:hypothetical protein